MRTPAEVVTSDLYCVLLKLTLLVCALVVQMQFKKRKKQNIKLRS